MVKLITFDLDDTLLTKQKVLTDENFRALRDAHDLGIEIVPATGRFWHAVPECVKALEFVNYAIIVNGAEILDVKRNISLAKSEIPVERALNMMRVFDDLPVIYDCVVNGVCYMSRKNYDRIAEFALDNIQRGMLENFRTPIDDEEFRERILNAAGVQKVQAFVKDADLRRDLLRSLPVVFPKNAIASSVANNLEINDINSGKGYGLKKLCEILGIDVKNALSFGDGLNDIDMIEAAGIGVAMNNACDELKQIADYVTLKNCNESGVAEGIRKFCFGQ